MKVPFGQPMISQDEKELVSSVLDGPILVHGQKATDFESSFKQYTGSANAISVSSCTAGMHLVWLTVGLKPGDEVIVPSQTHVATAHAVELAGGTPVFVDVEPLTGNIDVECLKGAITARTRGIAVVHYLGVPASMREVVQVAREHGLFVLEDCALSLGARYREKHTGIIGDAGVFSFYPVKHITTAEGGMILVKDQKMAEELKLKKAFGVTRAHGERKIPGMYDVLDLGLNYRMSEIHAAIGLKQLGKLDKFISKRQQNFKQLEGNLGGRETCKILPQPFNENVQSSFYCASLLLKDIGPKRRAQLMLQLQEKGVGTSVYYPHPVPRFTYYQKKYSIDKNAYKNAAYISDNSIALPVGPHLGEGQIKFLISSLIEVLDENEYF